MNYTNWALATLMLASGAATAQVDVHAPFIRGDGRPPVVEYRVGTEAWVRQIDFATASGISLSENVANNQDFVRDFADAQLGFDVAWEADFWHKFRRGVKAQQAAYMTSVADYENALVSLSAEVARTYAAVRTFERTGLHGLPWTGRSTCAF